MRHWLLLAFVAFALTSSAFAQNAAPDVTAFDSNPGHLWNRLYAAWFVRTGADGKIYGLDTVDPLLWPNTHFLLTEPTHGAALRVLREFTDGHGEALIRDPMKRLLLQRDLWAAFDWAAGHRDDEIKGVESANARSFERPLAEAIRQLALTAVEVERLPDNYRDTVAAKEFAGEFSAATNPNAYLSAGLFDADGPWVCIVSEKLGATEPILLTKQTHFKTVILHAYNSAPLHVAEYDGHSAFLVFINLPGGRPATLAYLDQVHSFKGPSSGPETPQFPAGTQLALVRQMIAISPDGDLLPTHVTEDIQLRVCTSVDPNRFGVDQEAFAEFLINRPRLLAHLPGTLRAVGRDEKGPPQFRRALFDPLEISSGTHHSRAEILNCADCHTKVGIFSVESRSELFLPATLRAPQLLARGPDEGRAMAVIWKESRRDWGILEGLWEN